MESKLHISLDGIESEIRDILYQYIRQESFTFSPGEKDAEAFFLSCFRSQPYWQAHPELVGTNPAANDPLGRAAAFAMVRGTGADTVVFVHHNDVVTTEDFKRLQPLAFSPDELERELFKIKDSFSPEIRQDLESGRYLFGRGVCDMKGGGAIQIALLRRYAELARTDASALPGNLIVLAVPDEENLSAGMRAAAPLLVRLREEYGLRYRMIINSEPHQRKDPETGVFSVGSVGKLMPFFYVRGYLAHAGKVFEGFNPTNVLSAIVRRTELNMDLSDTVGNEAAPPPTWLFCRDQKIKYDVSMPLAVAGCLSVLTLDQTPATLLSRIRPICETAFDEVIGEMNESYTRFLRATKQPLKSLPWKTCVMEFSGLYAEAKAAYGSAFEEAFQAELAQLTEKFHANEMNMIDCNFALVDFVYRYIDDLSPRVIYGLIPPYYPNVCNELLEGLSDTVRSLGYLLDSFTRETYGQHYHTENYFTGISDLSYTSLSGSEEILRTLRDTMPLFGTLYDVPAKEIEAVSMPCINIGPWGKDFHKLTERVLKEDLYERTPCIIRHAIELIFGDQ